ncbi:nucleoside/nucleotide kinase family protein [Salinicola sp. LHM]|uniref:nucleoside/nucleotide kinase family protein n=1 Tax=Salinicola TaxID=404432 RepID=UPI000DA1CF8C|nr:MULTISPECIES: nucleoside/nucleotide kinase family protein [Salinicola]MDF3917615.1 nucleoside/nucleotide kinase family protein [Salinicola salarius]MED5501635.1 nucleoside/nucleotide kinase family protein [Pseudomonadota bacterium]WQH31529.1 nucleoside/nucleotide kinase family protein [Salinicola sp. LHM]
MPITIMETRALSIDIDPLILDAARSLIDSSKRRILGLVGAPGSGKSTLSEALLAALGDQAQVVPMDGFHLSNRQLDALGRAQRKGAPDTFDAFGYRDLLHRLRASYRNRETVYAPGFYREIEEPIAASIAVTPGSPLIITEGNYLLLEEEPWPRVRAMLDEVWFLDVDRELREERLVARHMQFGRTERQAREWVRTTDALNAERIEAMAASADRQLWWNGSSIRFKSV